MTWPPQAGPTGVQADDDVIWPPETEATGGRDGSGDDADVRWPADVEVAEVGPESGPRPVGRATFGREARSLAAGGVSRVARRSRDVEPVEPGVYRIPRERPAAGITRSDGSTAAPGSIGPAAGQQSGRQPEIPAPRRPGGRAESDADRDDAIRRAFGGFRQVTIVSPHQGAGRTTATLLLASAFGRVRGAGVIAWDVAPGSGKRRSTTLAAALLRGDQPARGQLAAHLSTQDDGCDLLDAGAADTGVEFGIVRDALARYYHLSVVDTGSDVHTDTWQRALEASDQVLVMISAASSASSSSAVRLLDQMESTGQRRLIRHAVTVITAPPGRFEAGRRDADMTAIQRHFGTRTRAVHVVPYDRALASAGPIRFDAVAAATRAAWLRIAAAVAEGM